MEQHTKIQTKECTENATPKKYLTAEAANPCTSESNAEICQKRTVESGKIQVSIERNIPAHLSTFFRE